MIDYHKVSERYKYFKRLVSCLMIFAVSIWNILRAHDRVETTTLLSVVHPVSYFIFLFTIPFRLFLQYLLVLYSVLCSSRTAINRAILILFFATLRNMLVSFLCQIIKFYDRIIMSVILLWSSHHSVSSLASLETFKNLFKKSNTSRPMGRPPERWHESWTFEYQKLIRD